ncbi:cytochrome c3 family protein [Rhodoferax sp.]|uniref:cytochrome c3 family protein n=1 Tax=Rhodoferax sp. TaxID=50421 RepID=UPI00271883AA|nr:cytochrome c3 family protein [Rhodoferax sp.]MDO9196937.1 cytochrome c3 family protein [Rhodoferax sp.]
MNRTFKIILAINLVVLAVLTFAYPHLMVGPGKLIPGHKQLDTDCFACHVSLTGANSEKCASCHKPADIGRLTTKGAPVVKPLTSTPFHQKLISQDCVACHSDHAGVKRYHLKGYFDHALLKKETADQCQACHKPPADALHKQISGNCAQCHNQKKWTPATFDHDKYFVLDRDHNASCVTCHVLNDYSRYTCYGCHEHTPANVRREHVEEGIRDFDNCVECHRSGNKRDIKGGKGGDGDKREHD